MKKLRLEIDALVVESFESLPSPGDGRGTVAGHGLIPFTDRETCTTDPFGPISDDEPTCQISCGQLETCQQLGCPIIPYP